MWNDSEAQNLFKRNYPLYGQLPNSCGLATILMLVDPPHFPRIENFLTELSVLIDPHIPRVDTSISEFRHQYALEYFLLKAQGFGKNTELYKYLETRFAGIYEDQKALNMHLLTAKREKFLEMNMIAVVKAYDDYILGENDLITGIMLEDEVKTMKTDIEIKLLMELLGFQFVKLKEGDATGAIDLSQGDTQKNVDLLLKSFQNPKVRIIYGHQTHWMALDGITTKRGNPFHIESKKNNSNLLKDLIFTFNDPIVPSVRDIAYRELSQESRFYVFEDRGENLGWLWNSFIANSKYDIPLEIEKSIQVTKELAKSQIVIDSTLSDRLEKYRIAEEKRVEEITAKFSPLRKISTIMPTQIKIAPLQSPPKINQIIEQTTSQSSLQSILQTPVQKLGSSKNDDGWESVEQTEKKIEKKPITEADVFEDKS